MLLHEGYYSYLYFILYRRIGLGARMFALESPPDALHQGRQSTGHIARGRTRPNSGLNL